MQAYKRTKFYNKPLRLSKKQKKHPDRVIRDFYTWYHLDDMRHLLQEWMEAAITSENAQFESARDRSTLYSFYQNIEKMAEAAYLMIREQLPEPIKTPAMRQEQAPQ